MNSELHIKTRNNNITDEPPHLKLWNYFQSYEHRLESFVHSPIRLMKLRTKLAMAGFYHTHVRDQVSCFHCNTKIEGVKLLIQFTSKHREQSPTCPCLPTLMRYKPIPKRNRSRTSPRNKHSFTLPSSPVLRGLLNSSPITTSLTTTKSPTSTQDMQTISANDSPNNNASPSDITTPMQPSINPTNLPSTSTTTTISTETQTNGTSPHVLAFSDPSIVGCFYPTWDKAFATIPVNNTDILNNRVARWIYSQLHIICTYHYLLHTPVSASDLSVSAHLAWNGLSEQGRTVFYKLATVARDFHYSAPISPQPFPPSGIAYWRLRYLHLRNETRQYDHPILRLDRFLASVHLSNPIVESTLLRLEIIDAKRYEVEVIERSLNTVGLRLDFIRNVWIIRPREMNDDFFMGETYFSNELKHNLLCIDAFSTIV